MLPHTIKDVLQCKTAQFVQSMNPLQMSTKLYVVLWGRQEMCGFFKLFFDVNIDLFWISEKPNRQGVLIVGDSGIDTGI